MDTLAKVCAEEYTIITSKKSDIEIWKDCKFDSNYKVSNFGNIKKYNNKGELIKLNASIKKNYCKKKVFKFLEVKEEKGKQKTYRIHRLVCEAFKENKNNCKYVIHIDGNTFNNHVDNLKWCNSSDISIYNSRYKRDITEQGEERIRILKMHEKKYRNKRYFKHVCVCGSNYIQYNIARHLQTKKHIEYVENMKKNKKK